MDSSSKFTNKIRRVRLLSTGLLSALLFMVSLTSTAARADEPTTPPEVFLVNVVANRALIGSALEVYRLETGAIFVDLDFFVEIIDFDIARNGNTRSGTIHAEDMTFRLDTESNRVSYAGKTRTLTTSDLITIEGTVLVEQMALAEWFDIEIAFDAHEQSLTVVSQHPLPFQQEVLRKQRQAVLENTNSTVTPEDTLEVPNQYHTFTSPQLDLSAAFYHDQDADLDSNTGTLAISAGFDLIGNAIYYNGNFNSDFDDTTDIQQRLTIEKNSRFPNEDIFLGINSYTLGDLYSSEVPLLFSGAMAKGVRLARGDYYNTTKSETIDVVGDGPPDWEVELYRDDVLLDFTVVGNDGRFVFSDTSLYYGRNRFVAKLYGPGGQTRTKELDYWGGGRPLEGGETRYSLNYLDYQSGVIDADLIGGSIGTRTTASAQVDSAISSWMQMGIGVTHAEIEDRSISGLYTSQNYVRTNFSFNFKSASLSADVVHQFEQGNAYHLSLRGATLGQQLTITQEIFDDDFESQRTRSGEKLSSRTFIEVSSPLELAWLNHYSLRVTNQTQANSDSENRVRLSLNGYVGDLFWANRVERVAPPNQEDRYEGDFRISKRFGDFLVRGEANYNSRYDNVVENVSALVGWKISPRVYNQTKVISTFSGSTKTMLDNELTWKPNKFAIAVRGATNFDERWSLGMRLSTAVGFDQDNKLMINARPYSGTANVLLRFFIDQNDNGEFDLAEKPVRGVILNKYFANSASNTNGELLLTKVPVGAPLEIKESEIKLGDPFLKMNKRLIRVYSHRGGTIHADLGLSAVGGIEGTITVMIDGKPQVLPNQTVQLLRKQAVIAQTTTQFDGYFSFEDVRTNRDYVLSIVDTTNPSRSLTKPFKLDAAQDYLELGTLTLEHRPVAPTLQAAHVQPVQPRRSYKILAASD